MWSSEVEDPVEMAPAGELTGMSFTVDTEAPPAPTVRGGSGNAIAVSHAPDLVALRFYAWDAYTDRKAAPAQEVTYNVSTSGPAPDISVRAKDRADNLGATATTTG